jgi:hypothetical protein
MTTDVRKAELHELFEQHHVRYEVRAYYVVLDQRPESGPEVEQRVQAGFDVNLFAPLEKYRFPLYGSEEARMVVDHCESLAQEIQSAAGHSCTVEVIPNPTLVLDTQKHFQPEAMLQIRISHDRGLDQPAGPSEDQALKAVREALHELGVRES